MDRCRTNSPAIYTCGVHLATVHCLNSRNGDDSAVGLLCQAQIVMVGRARVDSEEEAASRWLFNAREPGRPKEDYL